MCLFVSVLLCAACTAQSLLCIFSACTGYLSFEYHLNSVFLCVYLGRCHGDKVM